MKTHRLFSMLVMIALALPVLSQPAHAAGGPLLGIYYGNQGWKMDQVQAVESWQGKRHAVVNLFTDWCSRSQKNLFGQQLLNIWNNRNVPMVTWEPMLCSGDTADIEVRIANGEFDSYVTSWAGDMKTFLSGPDATYGTADDRRAYLRLGHEMNGNWYNWGGALGSNDPSNFVRMWNRVRGIFSGKGIDSTRLQWVWCVNNEDVGAYRAEQYYPGDGAVDWVAIDGYNFGASQSWSTWRAPTDTFGPMLARLRTLTSKPVAITETGTSSQDVAGTNFTPNIARKNQWISDFFGYSVANNIRMIVWFNTDKETDWAFFGSTNGDGSLKFGTTTYKTYSAYKSAVAATSLTTSDTANVRLLTDLQFAGQ